MSEFMIPVTKVEMSSDDFNELRKTIKRMEFQVDFQKDRAEKLDRFVDKLITIVNHQKADLDFIMDELDYDLSISCGVSEKPNLMFKPKRLK